MKRGIDATGIKQKTNRLLDEADYALRSAESSIAEAHTIVNEMRNKPQSDASNQEAASRKNTDYMTNLPLMLN